jgi:hypothetical protein
MQGRKGGDLDVFLAIYRVKGNGALEIRATSNWDPKDGNHRISLFSALRLGELKTANQSLPILHAIMTLEYDSSTFSTQ